MVPVASLQAHVSLTSRRNPLSVEPLLISPRIMPPGVTQEADVIPHGSKDPSNGLITERYWDVLPPPLARMFSGRSGGPETLGGDGDPNEADAE